MRDNSESEVRRRCHFDDDGYGHIDQKRYAAVVREIVEDLNCALAEAYRAGIEIELDVMTVSESTLSPLPSVPIIRVTATCRQVI